MENKEQKQVKKEGNPLVTAERLHRFKCPYCGSKDKNIVDIKVQDDREEEETYNEWVSCAKIVCCNDCGHTMLFSHSALVFSNILANAPISMASSENYVRQFHKENHEDPEINPHTVEVRKHHSPPLHGI